MEGYGGVGTSGCSDEVITGRSSPGAETVLTDLI